MTVRLSRAERQITVRIRSWGVLVRDPRGQAHYINRTCGWTVADPHRAEGVRLHPHRMGELVSLAISDRPIP